MVEKLPQIGKMQVMLFALFLGLGVITMAWPFLVQYRGLSTGMKAQQISSTSASGWINDVSKPVQYADIREKDLSVIDAFAMSSQLSSLWLPQIGILLNSWFGSGRRSRGIVPRTNWYGAVGFCGCYFLLVVAACCAVSLASHYPSVLDGSPDVHQLSTTPREVLLSQVRAMLSALAPLSALSSLVVAWACGSSIDHESTEAK